MRAYGAVAAIGACLLASACATPQSITEPISAAHRPDRFVYCAGGGCRREFLVSFDDADWTRVRDVFAPRPADAASERGRIATAVGLIEAMIGDIAGTVADRGGTLGGLFEAGQLDCFSEASNTSNFIGLMYRDGLLRFHRPKPPRLRGIGYHGASPVVHATAVVEEIESRADFAVDSWFFDNGAPAAVIALPEWLDGFSPAGAAWI